MTTYSPGGPTQPASLDPAVYSFLEAYPDAIAIHRGGTLLYANHAGLRLVGATTTAEVLGRSVLDFVHPDSRDLVVQRMRTAAEGQPGDLIDEMFIRLDGSPIDVEVISLPIQLQDGMATQLIVRDVSRLRRIERDFERLRDEAREAERGHRFTQEALDLAEAAAGLGVWDWKIGTNELRWTKGLEPLHGMEPGTFRGTFEHFLEAVIEDDRPALLGVIEQALQDESGEFEARMRVRLPNGTLRWILGKGRVFRDANGELDRMVGIGLDIDHRTRHEIEATENLEFLRLVTSLLPANVAYFDTDERYVFVNDTYREWFGIDPKDVVGKTAREFMGARAYQIVAPALQQALAGTASELDMDVLNIHTGGRRYIHAKYTPHLDSNGLVRGVAAMITDVTEERREAEVLERRASGQELLNDLSEAIQAAQDMADVAREAVGPLVQWFASAAALDLNEGGRFIRLAAAVGPDLDVSPDSIPVPSTHWPGANTGRRRAVTFHFSEGMEATAVQIPLVIDGSVEGVLTLVGVGEENAEDRELMNEVCGRVRAAFERARLLERLKAALSAKDDFIGFTTHELKTPLTVLLGFADVLKRRAAALGPEKIAEVADDLLVEARRLEEIVENMLLLARSERGTADEPALVRRVADEVIKTRHWRYPDRPILKNFRGENQLVSAPAGWIDQVLENLLSNAEKYSDPKSPIEIEVTTTSRFVTTRVLDRGRGVTEELCREVFEPFFRANPSEPGVPGVGLGLTVCRKLIDRLGGEIWLRPREGGGTDAGFRLPIATQYAAIDG